MPGGVGDLAVVLALHAERVGLVERQHLREGNGMVPTEIRILINKSMHKIGENENQCSGSVSF